jgi:hypothetical protein
MAWLLDCNAGGEWHWAGAGAPELAGVNASATPFALLEELGSRCGEGDTQALL